MVGYPHLTPDRSGFPVGTLPIEAVSPTLRLKETYDGYFVSLPADTPERLDMAYRLRYDVYCVENNYERSEDNPDGKETDRYDSHSVHELLMHCATGQVAGTVRLIFPDRARGTIDMPIREVCRHPWVQYRSEFLPTADTAEISRFSVSKQFRKRATDSSVGTIGSEMPANRDNRRVITHISLGLMHSIVRMCAKNGIAVLCAVMEPALLRLLSRLGIHFFPLGPIVDYHGRRQPCFSDLDLLLARTWLDQHDVWELVTDDGKLWPLNERLIGPEQTRRVEEIFDALHETETLQVS